MKMLKLWRTFKEGFSNFCRNGWLSFATISVLAISLYIISLTFVIGITGDLILKNIQEKVSISVYFSPTVEESEILSIKEKLGKYQEVKSVEYVSKDQALEEFKALSGNDPSITRALDVIGDNPLLPSLMIKANSPSQYQVISDALRNSFNDQINRISYEENKTAIERLNSIIKLVKKVGTVLGIIFVFVAIMITFNTIRITMYSHRQEFEIMRLVGASNLYVEMPYIFEGIFYGISASVVAIILLFATVRFVSSLTATAIFESNMLTFYSDHFFLIFITLLTFGVTLGIISSFIAIRRYLKV